jgi:hypothetical protein
VRCQASRFFAGLLMPEKPEKRVPGVLEKAVTTMKKGEGFV